MMGLEDEIEFNETHNLLSSGEMSSVTPVALAQYINQQSQLFLLKHGIIFRITEKYLHGSEKRCQFGNM